MGIDHRQTGGVVVQCLQSHIKPRGDIAAGVAAVGADAVVCDGRAQINHEQLASRAGDGIRAHGGSQAVKPQGRRRGIVDSEGHGGVDAEVDNPRGPALQSTQHGRRTMTHVAVYGGVDFDVGRKRSYVTSHEPDARCRFDKPSVRSPQRQFCRRVALVNCQIQTHLALLYLHSTAPRRTSTRSFGPNVSTKLIKFSEINAKIGRLMHLFTFF